MRILDRLTALLFFFGVVLIPFDAISGLRILGELGNDASFYTFALSISLCAFKMLIERMNGSDGHVCGARGGVLASIVLISVILVSATFNLSEIAGATFHGRDGLAKFLTSTLVVVYGLTLGITTCNILPGRWYKCLILPVCLSATLCIGFSALEALSHAGYNIPLYRSLNSFIHSGADAEFQPWDRALNLKLLEGWDPRLRSVSFEPPAFGNFAGMAYPWILCAVFMSHGLKKFLHFFLLAAFTALVVGCQARTGWLLLAANMASYGILRCYFVASWARRLSSTPYIALFLMLISLGFFGALYLAYFDIIVLGVVNGNSVSDLSRLAWQVTAFNMFYASPLFGRGLGQFAFNSTSFMPSWGWFSPEVLQSLRYPEAPWPNTYSIYARLASELGLLGLISWALIWITLIFSVARAALIYARCGRPVPSVAYAIIMNCVDVLVTGWTTDTFKSPMFWICLGAGCCFSARAWQVLIGSSRPVLLPKTRSFCLKLGGEE